MAMNIDFTGKTVLVTGGGRGLGKEMALQFAGCGANVYIANRKEDQGLATVKDVSYTHLLARMLCGCSAASTTAKTEAVKYDRPVLRTDTGSNEKNFTVFAMDTVMQFQIYGGNDEVEEKVREKIEELEDTLSVTKENSPMWELNEKKEAKFAPEIAKQMEKTLELCKDCLLYTSRCV